MFNNYRYLLNITYPHVKKKLKSMIIRVIDHKKVYLREQILLK